MRVTVDESLCEANGFCESLALEIFQIGDSDVVHIVDGPVPEARGCLSSRVQGPVWGRVPWRS